MASNPQAVSVDPLTDNLIAEAERLDARQHAETGSPSILVAEDPAMDRSARPAGRDVADGLAAHFAQLARAYASRKPELDDDDIAKLIQVLADRRFPGFDIGAAPRAPLAIDRPPPSSDLTLPAAAPPVLADLTRGMASGRTIRTVNFHGTPRYRVDEFRRQIEACARDYEPITRENFASAVDGNWPHPRPGLMPALFEGYRDNLDVLLPILEEFGFTAWFFVPPAFLSVPDREQRGYAAGHRLFLPDQDEYPDQRIALTWDEAREISRRGHVFACHTRTHHELRADTPRAVLQDEIVAGKAEMEAELGTEIEIFCWLEGAALGVNREADAMLREAGFRYLFSNFKIQKLQQAAR